MIWIIISDLTKYLHELNLFRSLNDHTVVYTMLTGIIGM